MRSEISPTSLSGPTNGNEQTRKRDITPELLQYLHNDQKVRKTNVILLIGHLNHLFSEFPISESYLLLSLGDSSTVRSKTESPAGPRSLFNRLYIVTPHK